MRRVPNVAGSAGALTGNQAPDPHGIGDPPPQPGFDFHQTVHERLRPDGGNATGYNCPLHVIGRLQIAG